MRDRPRTKLPSTKLFGDGHGGSSLLSVGQAGIMKAECDKHSAFSFFPN